MRKFLLVSLALFYFLQLFIWLSVHVALASKLSPQSTNWTMVARAHSLCAETLLNCLPAAGQHPFVSIVYRPNLQSWHACSLAIHGSPWRSICHSQCPRQRLGNVIDRVNRQWAYAFLNFAAFSRSVTLFIFSRRFDPISQNFLPFPESMSKFHFNYMF